MRLSIDIMNKEYSTLNELIDNRLSNLHTIFKFISSFLINQCKILHFNYKKYISSELIAQ